MPRPPSILIYRDAAGEFRWRLRAANGQIVADSAEGYRRHSGADRAVRGLLRIFGGPPWAASATRPDVLVPLRMRREKVPE